jgi:hypothetical protein
MVLKRPSTIAGVAIAIVLATTTLGLAAPARGGGAHGGFASHPGGHVQGRSAFQGHPGFHGQPGFHGRPFDGRRFDGRRFDGRRFDGRRFDHGFRSRAVIVAPFVAAPFVWPYPYYDYPSDPGYGYSAPAVNYWYYCPSYGAYYPNVQSCPEPWVTVPG